MSSPKNLERGAGLRRLKLYPAYKDSGVEWLREVPSSWEVKPLKHLTAFSTGWTPPTGREDLYGGEHLWANISDLGPKVLRTTEKTISDMAIREARLRIVTAGSLLFSFKLSVGAVSIAGVDMYTNEAIAAFAPSERINIRYLYWAAPVLLPLNAQENIYGAPLLNRERIANARLLNPPTAEQHAIAAFLDRETVKIDTLMAKKERLIELLREKRTALITRAVTKGLDPKVTMKDSGVEWLGKIPAHWGVKRIKWAARMVSGHTPDKKVESYWQGGDIPWISLADTGQLREVDYIADTAVRTTSDGIAHSSAQVLPAGTVVFSRDATIGLCAITRSGMAVSQHFIGWVCGPSLEPEYLLFVLRSMTQELERLTMGATVRTIGMPDVRSLVTPIPPLREQGEIVSHVLKYRSQVDALALRVREAIDRLKELRIALISAAVTGKIDVRGETV